MFETKKIIELDPVSGVLWYDCVFGFHLLCVRDFALALVVVVREIFDDGIISCGMLQMMFPCNDLSRDLAVEIQNSIKLKFHNHIELKKNIL